MSLVRANTNKVHLHIHVYMIFFYLCVMFDTPWTVKTRSCVYATIAIACRRYLDIVSFLEIFSNSLFATYYVRTSDEFSLNFLVTHTLQGASITDAWLTEKNDYLAIVNEVITSYFLYAQKGIAWMDWNGQKQICFRFPLVARTSLMQYSIN